MLGFGCLDSVNSGPRQSLYQLGIRDMRQFEHAALELQQHPCILHQTRHPF